MKVLLIDDQREKLPLEGKYGVKITHIARNFADGINALKDLGPIDLLLLDHDLSDFDEEKNELTGYMIMQFLEENPEYLPKNIELVTANPVGRQRMQAIVDKLIKR